MPSIWRCRWTGSAEPDRSVVHRTLSRWLDGDHHAQRKAWSWTCTEDTSPREPLIGLLDDRLADRLCTGRSGVAGDAVPGRPADQTVTVPLCLVDESPPPRRQGRA